MNVLFQILVGGLTGWLTGKAVEIEGRVRVVREGHILDIIYGMVGGIVGEYLFFWIVIGQGNALSDFATTILGAITVVGVARSLVERWRRAQSYKTNAFSSSFDVKREKAAVIEPIEAPAAP